MNAPLGKNLGRTPGGKRRLTPPNLKKPHPSSRLYQLGEEKAQRIEEWGKTNTLHSLRLRILKEFGFTVAISALSRWLAKRRVTSPVEQAKQIADIAREVLRNDPDLSDKEESVNQVAQAIFEAQAMAAGDMESYLALKKARQKDAEIAITNRRIELLEAAAAKAAAAEALSKSPLGDAEYAEKMRAIFAK